MAEKKTGHTALFYMCNPRHRKTLTHQKQQGWSHRVKYTPITSQHLLVGSCRLNFTELCKLHFMYPVYSTIHVCLLLQGIWLAAAVEGGVQLSLTSPDGDQGYPGEVQVSVSYTLQVDTSGYEFILLHPKFPFGRANSTLLFSDTQTFVLPAQILSLNLFAQGEELTVEYQAQANKTTPINLTNHSYFNLAGQVSDMDTFLGASAQWCLCGWHC